MNLDDVEEMLARGRLPLEPLMKCAQQYGMNLSDVARRCGVSKRSLDRYRDSGVPVFMADEMCDRVGTHPVLVWDELWFRVVVHEKVGLDQMTLF